MWRISWVVSWSMGLARVGGLAIVVGLGAGVASGCSSDAPAGHAGASGSGGTTCEQGGPLQDGSCVRAGVPADKCGVGFTPDGKQGCEPVLPAAECSEGTMPALGKADCQVVGIPPGQCGVGFVSDGHAGCEPVLPEGVCPGGTVALLGHTDCQPVGVPADQCATGFSSDGKGGCEPIFPASACPAGQMAIPGETSCHSPQSCGMGAWGDIPIDTTTVFVDASYTGSDGDGSKEKPWTTLADGLSHAAAGAVVAVAAGSYPENLTLAKGVKLWGVCPSNVHLTGGVAGAPTLTVNAIPQGESVEIHGLSVSGPADGIDVTQATGVTLAGLWIHDTGGDSVGLTVVGKKAMVTLTGSLLEKIPSIAILMLAGTATIERTVIRSTLPQASDQKYGRGIDMYRDNAGNRSTLTLSQSLLDDNGDTGLRLSGSDATVQSSVIRNTKPRATDQLFGRGIDVRDDDGARSTLTLTSSLLEKNHDAGLFVAGSDATLQGVVVRTTQARPSDSTYGEGIAVSDSGGQRGNVVLTSSIIASNHLSGLYISGSDVTMTGVVVRDTLSETASKASGDGIQILNDGDVPATLTLSSCLLDGNHSSGLFMGPSQVTVNDSAIVGTLPEEDNSSGGYGIEVVNDGAQRGLLTVSRTVLESNRTSGLYVIGTDATVTDSLIRHTQVQLSDRTMGLGIQMHADAGQRGKLDVRGTRIDQNHSAGIAVFGSDATLQTTSILGTLYDETPSKALGVGLAMADEEGQASAVTLASSLIDGNADYGISGVGSNLTLQSTIVRNSLPDSSMNGGGGIVMSAIDGIRSNLILTGSLIDNNRSAGVYLLGSGATVDGSVIRDTQPTLADMSFGAGLCVVRDGDTPAQLTMTSTIVERNHAAGLAILGGVATVIDSVIRDTQAEVSTMGAGLGVLVERSEPGKRGALTMTGSLVDRNIEGGLYIQSSDATVRTSVLRNTVLRSSGGLQGPGILVQNLEDERGSLSLGDSLLDANHTMGLSVVGSDTTVEGTLVRNTLALDSTKNYGRGISVQMFSGQRGTMTLAGSIIERNLEIGVACLSSDLTVSKSIVRDTQVRASDQSFGDGLSTSLSNVTVDTSVFSGNARAAVSNFSSKVTIHDSDATCSMISFDEESLSKDPLTGEPVDPVKATYSQAHVACSTCEGTEVTCRVVSKDFTAPEPVPPIAVPPEIHP